MKSNVPSVHTEEKPRESRVRKIFKIFEKNTVFNEHPVSGIARLLGYNIKQELRAMGDQRANFHNRRLNRQTKNEGTRIYLIQRPY